MSATEKPGFFSKLFGRSVSRQASSSESTPSSSSNGDHPSSNEDQANSNGSPTAPSKSLRYLSPTAIENSFMRAPSRNVDSITEAARKRPMDAPQITTGFTNGSFYTSDTAKRFRGSTGPSLNTSLIAEPVTRSDLPRLDTTWSAGMGLGSPSLSSYSPCSSVRSLRSRITRPSSRTSVLSSKTAALLGQIEKVSTPAQDARRMPMLRVGLNKERWNSLGTSSTISAPPLNRVSSVPSRYQVMTSFFTPMQKKPYWRDVARERVEEVREESRVPSYVLSSLPETTTTRAENGEKNGTSEPLARASHQPVLKGSDGSNVNRGKNTFSANEIADDSEDLAALNKVKGLNDFQFKFALPTKGFLSKTVKPTFSLAKPTKITEEPIEESEESSGESSESEESYESNGSESGSSEDEREVKRKTAEKTSDTSSSAENTSKESKDDAKKVSPPRTVAPPAFSIPAAKPAPFSATPLPTITITTASKWDCTECFISNDASTSKCLACGSVKGGAAPVPSSSSSTFSSTPFAPLKTASANWDCSECFISNGNAADKCMACGSTKPGAAAAAPAASAASTGPWDCSSCCVPNKATDVKCVCCGETKPGASAASVSAAPSNPFGDKAFKPTTAPTSSFSFGFNGGSASSSSAAPISTTTITFGAKPAADSSSSSAPKPPTAGFVFGAKPTAAAAAPATTSAPLAAAAALAAPLTTAAAAPAAEKPLFGATTAAPSLTSSPFTFGAKTNGETKPSATTPSLPLFGASAASAAPSAALFGLPSSSSGSAAPKLAAPLFGSSSTSSTPTTTASSTAAPFLFGAPSSSSTLSSSTPLFGASSSTAASSLLSSTTTTTSATPAAGISLFGAPSSSSTPSTIPLFGGAGASTATASATPSLSFNFAPAASTTQPPNPLFGAPSETKPSLFGASKPDEEGPGAKRAMFGSSASSGFNFGAPAAAPAMGGNLFGSSAPSVPAFGSLTQSSSTPSFGAPAAPPSSFNFGSTPLSTAPPPSTFSFGAQPAAAAATASASPFMFGQQPNAAAPSFGAAPSMPSFGAAPAAAFAPPAAADASNPFAFNASVGSGARKMIHAKRRLPGKK